MKRKIFLLTALCGLAFAYKDVSSDEIALFSSSGEALLVDVRLDEEWIESGVIPNSATITYFDKQARALKPEFLKKLSELTKNDKTKPIALVCRTGVRSKLVAGILDREGYKNVYNYKEGIVLWIAEKRAVSKPKLGK